MKNKGNNRAQEIPTPSDESLQEIYDLVYTPIRVKPNHIADDLIGTQLSRFSSPEEARLEINSLSEFPDEEFEDEDGDFDDETESEYREDDFALTEEDDEDWWDRNNPVESESEDDDEGYW